MIDHVYISVTNIRKSLAFYCEALKPLGWKEFGKYQSTSGPEGIPDLFGVGDGVYGTGNAVGSSIWLRERNPGETGLTSESSAIPMSWSTPPTLLQSKPAPPTKVNQQIAPTLLAATTPRMSPTLTATESSSYTKLGTQSGTHRFRKTEGSASIVLPPKRDDPANCGGCQNPRVLPGNPTRRPSANGERSN